jgi:tetratricopeptide (TPR) repeat protein
MTPQLQLMLQQAIQAFENGNLDSADLMLKRLLQVDSKNLPALHVLGLIKASQGSYKESADYLGRAARLNPNDASIQYNLAKALMDCGDDKGATPHHKKAVELNPKNPQAWLNYGKSAFNLGRHDEALAHYDRALQLKPDYYEALVNKGVTLHELKQFSEALAHYDRALLLKPDACNTHMNLGITFHALQRDDEALTHYDRALQLKPDYPEALVNRGLSLHDLNRFDEAIAHYDRALQLKPDYYEASWNKSISLLTKGDLENGFLLYEVRRKTKQVLKIIGGARSFSSPAWRGTESLVGKTIFLYGEQGFGDCIQFSRYAKLVANLGATVILEVPPALVPIMNNLTGVSRVISMGEELPSFDFHSAIMSLPAIFKTNLSNIPCANQYINIDHHSNKLIEWRDRFGAKTKPRIGLAWSGNLSHANDSNRSLLLNSILPYLPAGFNYVSLQKEVRPEDKLALEANPNILNFSESLNDFLDTAALICQLDLVISVDTSVAHLSAALGKKTWILIPFVPDWRWLLDREDNPWYSSVKLYRQTSIGNWASPLIKMKADLEKIKSML